MLLGAPLCFGTATSRSRDALVSLASSELDESEPCPGSLLSQASAVASPDTFLWSRLRNAASNAHALEIHVRVERWALDEVPLPGKLDHQLIERLYRENQFCRGEMKIGDRLIGLKTCRRLCLRSATPPTMSLLSTRLNRLSRQWRPEMRASSNIRARLAYACSTSASWSGRTRKRKYGRKSSHGLMHAGIAPTLVSIARPC